MTDDDHKYREMVVIPQRGIRMFSRLLSVPLLIGAAVGVPYLATNGPNIDGLFDTDGFFDGGSSPGAPGLKQAPPGQIRPHALQGPGAALYPTETPLEGFPTISLNEVFNLNVSKEWVYQRWARKSTALSELGLYGIRVPLVTGTQLHDLAGSLTYFFGDNGQVNRISFHGTTGDTTQLVRLVAQQYGLQQQTTPIAGDQLFQIKSKNQVFSELRTRPAAVLWASSPHDSFSVDLELQRPSAATPLPSRLPPLPVVKAPPQPQPTPAEVSRRAETQNARERAKSGKSRDAGIDASEKWNPFFPRSRIPNKQVDNLDRHRRMW